MPGASPMMGCHMLSKESNIRKPPTGTKGYKPRSALTTAPLMIAESGYMAGDGVQWELWVDFCVGNK